MRRRDLLALLGGAAALPARAEETAPRPRLALAMPSDPISAMRASGLSAGYRAFFDELTRRGWVEGTTLTIERYSAAEQHLDYASLAKAVVARNPDLIVATGTDLLAAFKRSTKTIPIVAAMGDPIATGLATSLSHPGGNLTGASADAGAEIGGKRLGLLLDAFPSLARVGFLGSRTGWERSEGTSLKATAERAKIEVQPLLFPDPPSEADYRRLIEEFAKAGTGAIIVSQAPQNVANRRTIADVLRTNRLPALFPYPIYRDVDALLIYGPDTAEIWSHIADIANDILRGAKPGDIPIAQPTQFKLIVNLKTAKAQGFTIPASLVLLADDVIE